MGMRLRRSINLGGGFRINISKSGVGYSWGVPGYRITKTAKGRNRKTYSIPGTGISYVEENSSQKRKKQNYKPVQISEENLMDIDSADIKKLQPVEYEELLNTISKALIINRVSNIAMFFILFYSNPLFLIIGMLGFISKVIMLRYGKIQLEYELDENANEVHMQNSECWILLNKNKKLWQIIQSANVSNFKVNAGVSIKVNRSIIRFLKKTPYYINTNVDTVQIKLRKETLIFLPDKILIFRGLKAGAVNYNDITIKVSSTRFIEDGLVPKDAEIVDYTWQFVNKDGSPDRRYKNNRKLPICLYGVVKIESPNGINVEIQCSNISNTREFEDKIN